MSTAIFTFSIYSTWQITPKGKESEIGHICHRLTLTSILDLGNVDPWLGQFSDIDMIDLCPNVTREAPWRKSNAFLWLRVVFYRIDTRSCLDVSVHWFYHIHSYYFSRQLHSQIWYTRGEIQLTMWSYNQSNGVSRI